MKYNDETSMEPRLQEEIQELLTTITVNFCSQVYDSNPLARLGGICTAIHALTGEIWTPSWDVRLRYVLMNEDKTECITPDEL